MEWYDLMIYIYSMDISRIGRSILIYLRTVHLLLRISLAHTQTLLYVYSVGLDLQNARSFCNL